MVILVLKKKKFNFFFPQHFDLLPVAIFIRSNIIHEIWSFRQFLEIAVVFCKMFNI